MTVCAVILARDEAGRIEHALHTAAQVCDTAIVVDTGSQDDTRQRAQAAGAIVIERPWHSFGGDVDLVTTYLKNKWGTP